MSDDDPKPEDTTFQMYNPDTKQVEIYPKHQNILTVMYENATLSDAQSMSLHQFRMKKGWRTQDPMTGKIYNLDSEE